MSSVPEGDRGIRIPGRTIGFSVKSKGARGLARRALLIKRRFGVTAARMTEYLNQCVAIAQEFDTAWSLPITASVVRRRPDLIRDFSTRGLNFAVHGYVHNDHAVRSLDEQLESIERAKRIFTDNDIPVSGFRGPYLRYNASTVEALRSLGFEYHSSQSVTFAEGQESQDPRRRDAYKRAIELYSAQQASEVVVRPRDVGNLIDIPIALPDDEIMVDRFNFTENEQTATWLTTLEATYRRGDLFTVQLHPERIFECSPALCTILRFACQRQPEIWIASMEEITDWWKRRGKTVLEVEDASETSYRINMIGDPDVTLLVRGMPEVDSSSWYGGEDLANARTFVVQSPVKPVVGVSTRSPSRVAGFLHEEGFPTEVSDNPTQYGAYIDVDDENFNEARILDQIDESIGPLVRLSRWPNGARSALALTGDIDSITLQDFALRLWETR